LKGDREKMKITAEMKRYLAAIGRKGGRIMTPRKRAHLKRISKLPRPGARKKENE
jgi:hypothetical protein